jgi:hypothetical protein
MRAVSLLDVLLRIRQDMQARATGPYLYIGEVDVNILDCFTVGYYKGLSALGIEEGSDSLFGEWLFAAKKAWPSEGWGAAYLRECGGDHVRAFRKYLDFVAEFRSLSPEALAAIPWYAGGEHPSRRTASWAPTRQPAPTLDLLLEIRGSGRTGIYIGPVEVERMAKFIAGYQLCLSLAGFGDEEYPRFEHWLRQKKDISPGGSWPQVLLRECSGDQEQAVQKFLDSAAEFRSRTG